MAPVDTMENRLGERGRPENISASSLSLDLELFSDDFLCFSFSPLELLELSDLDFDPSLFSLFDLEPNLELDLDSFSFAGDVFLELLLLSLRSPDDLELDVCLRLEEEESLDLECLSRSPERLRCFLSEEWLSRECLSDDECLSLELCLEWCDSRSEELLWCLLSFSLSLSLSFSRDLDSLEERDLSLLLPLRFFLSSFPDSSLSCRDF